MKNIFKLFRTYNLNTWKKNRLQIALSIMSIAIAIATALSIQIISIYNIRYAKENSKALNEGDLCIKLYKPITLNQSILLHKLKEAKEIDYTTSLNMNSMIKHKNNISMGYIKLINAQKYPFYKAAGRKNYKDKLSSTSIIMDSTLAAKLNARRGDKISFALFASSHEKSYTIKSIENISGSTDAKIFGCILASKALIQDNGIKDRVDDVYIKVLAQKELNNINKTVRKSFKSTGTVTSWKDFFKQSRKSSKNSGKIMDCIALLTFIISGVSIGSTMLLMLIKRQKDFCIFKVYGMKNRLLKSLMMVEASIISLISSIAGIAISLFASNIILSSINSSLNIFSYPQLLPKPILLIILLSLAENIVFTFVPIGICTQIKAVSILREQNLSSREKIRVFLPSVFTMILSGISFSLYMGSILGAIYTIVFCAVGGILYGFILLSFTFIGKIKFARNKHVLLSQNNLLRQRKSLGLGAVILSLGLIFSGTILNLTSNIIPIITKDYSNKNPYNLLITTSPKQSEKAAEILSRQNFIKSCSRTLSFPCSLNGINSTAAKTLIARAENRHNNKRNIEMACSNLQINGFDIKKDMIRYGIKAGRWLKESDNNQNTAVIGDYFQNMFHCKINSTISLKLNGIVTDFKIIGITTHSLFDNSADIYVSRPTLNRCTSQLNLSYKSKNSSIQFLIKADTGASNKLIRHISKMLTGAFIVSIDSVFDSLNNFMHEQTKLFIYISAVCILSALFLIGNITIMTFMNRYKEFMILKALGARDFNIRLITLIEGLAIGTITGISSIAVCEGLSHFIIGNLIKLKYSSNIFVMMGILFTGIFISITAIILVLSKIRIKNLSRILREN